VQGTQALIRCVHLTADDAVSDVVDIRPTRRGERGKGGGKCEGVRHQRVHLVLCYNPFHKSINKQKT